MPRRPTPSFDYEYLAGLQSPDAPGEIFFLGEAAQQVLSQLAEVATWKTRWYNGDPADIEALAADIYEDLKVPYHLDDWIAESDETQTILRAILAGQCCAAGSEYISPLGSDEHTTTNTSNASPPATWGGDTVADQADYEELLCGAGDAYVDKLIQMANQMDEIAQVGAWTLGAISALLALAGGAGLILRVGYGLAAGVVSSLIGTATSATFTSAAADLEAARNDIRCAVVSESGAAGLAQAVNDALGGGVAWTLFFAHVDYASAWATMRDGGFGGNNLPVNRSGDCACGETFDGIADYTWTNTSGSRGWIGVDTAAGLCSPDYGISGNPTGGVSMTEIINQSGEAPPGGVSFYIRKIDVVVCGSGPGAAVEVVFNDLTTESMDLSGGAGTYTFVPVEQSKPARPSGGSAVRLTDPNSNHRDKQVIIYFDWE